MICFRRDFFVQSGIEFHTGKSLLRISPVDIQHGGMCWFQEFASPKKRFKANEVVSKGLQTVKKSRRKKISGIDCFSERFELNTIQ